MSTPPSITPYPLLLRPLLLEKVWGGRRLERVGKVLPKGGGAGAKYGESWEVADMWATSASGAGGGAVRSVIANGGMKGRTLGEAMAEWGEGMCGEAESGRGRSADGKAGEPAKAHGRDAHATAAAFPLLVKFLDASENLSVQVHPSPAYARAHAAAHLKTECWYIVEAEPGAVIYKGVRAGVTREVFARAARGGGAEIVDLLVSVPAAKGECHNLPSGTVHALGAGVLVAEVQTPSDTTYRLYDWGRSGREMHVEEGLEAMCFAGEPGYEEMARGLTVERLGAGETRRELVRTEFFVVEEVRLGAGGVGGAEELVKVQSSRVQSSKGNARGECVVVVVLEGECEIACNGPVHEVDGVFAPVGVKKGDAVVVPAANAWRAVVASVGGARVLCARV